METVPHRLFMSVVSLLLSVAMQAVWQQTVKSQPTLSVSNEEADMRGMGADM